MEEIEEGEMDGSLASQSLVTDSPCTFLLIHLSVAMVEGWEGRQFWKMHVENYVN